MQQKPKQLEAKIQASIIRYLESGGWFVIKIIQTNRNGLPDLLCILNGRYLWIEAKNETGKVAPLQEYRHAQLRGHRCEVISDARSTEDVKAYLKQTVSK